MWRLFLSLYLLIILTLGGFLFGLPLLVDNIIEKRLYDYGQGIAGLPQHLLERELEGIPQRQWREKLAEVKTHFGYEFLVYTLADFKDDEESLARLRRNRVTIGEDELEGVDFMLLPLAPSDLVVRIEIDQRNSEHVQRSIAGFFVLIQLQLEAVPHTEWPAIVERYARYASFPVALLTLSEATVKPEHRDRLAAGELVWYDPEGNTERYYQRLGDSDSVLKIGPIADAINSNLINTLALLLLASLFAIVLFLWIRPLWQDLGALRAAASALGRGELNQRATVSKRSRVAELASTFNAMAARIATLLGSHKELTDAVSHELRTPISRMQFALDMMNGTESLPDRERYISGMQADVNELEEMVNELLTYSRMDRPAPELQRTRVELEAWLAELATKEMAEFEPINLELVVQKENPSDLTNAYIETRLLHRALRNLLRNAARHARSHIQLTLKVSAENFDIAIADDGPGIPIDMRDRIFEPFTRADSSRHRDQGGYGLGLAIVKRICDWLGGSVHVSESAMGGAEFVLRLPRLA